MQGIVYETKLLIKIFLKTFPNTSFLNSAIPLEKKKNRFVNVAFLKDTALRKLEFTS